MDNEPRTICPYNNAHHILTKRMGTHLVKCRKNFPESTLDNCDFNSVHRVPQPELQYHHSVCPDRFKIEAAVYQEEGTDLTKFPVTNVAVDAEENWDDENVTTYNPDEYSATQEVLRHRDVAPPSLRKEFRNQERKRLQEINTGVPSAISKSILAQQTKPKTSQSSVDTAAELLKRIQLEH